MTGQDGDETNPETPAYAVLTLRNPVHVQPIHSVLDAQNLDSTQRREQMRVVVWMRSEASCRLPVSTRPRAAKRRQTCLFVPAAHHEVYHLLPAQRVLAFHDAESGQAPVYRVHAQVGGEMVHQVIFALVKLCQYIVEAYTPVPTSPKA